MEKLYTLVCLNPEEFDRPAICYENGPGIQPICSPNKSRVEARRDELAKMYEWGCYAVCELVPVTRTTT